MEYLSRSDWGAGPHRAGYPQDPTSKVGLVVHHTVAVMPDYDRDGHLHGDLDDIKRFMKALQVIRPDLGGEVPYHFVVFRGSGTVVFVVAEGRGRAWSGAHATDFNTSRLGVAFAGNAEVDHITPGIIEGFLWVGRTQLVAPSRAKSTFGHRDVKSTACPGANLYRLLPEIQPPFQSQLEELTMDQVAEIKAKVDKQTQILSKRLKREGVLTRQMLARQHRADQADLDAIQAELEAIDDELRAEGEVP